MSLHAISNPNTVATSPPVATSTSNYNQQVGTVLSVQLNGHTFRAFFPAGTNVLHAIFMANASIFPHGLFNNSSSEAQQSIRPLLVGSCLMMPNISHPGGATAAAAEAFAAAAGGSQRPS